MVYFYQNKNGIELYSYVYYYIVCILSKLDKKIIFRVSRWLILVKINEGVLH